MTFGWLCGCFVDLCMHHLPQFPILGLTPVMEDWKVLSPVWLLGLLMASKRSPPAMAFISYNLPHNVSNTECSWDTWELYCSCCFAMTKTLKLHENTSLYQTMQNTTVPPFPSLATVFISVTYAVSYIVVVYKDSSCVLSVGHWRDALRLLSAFPVLNLRFFLRL